MKELPSVSAFPIDKELRNSQERYYSANNYELPKKNDSVVNKINHIFSSNNHVYKSNVKIKMKNEIVDKVIVGKTSTMLLTLNGEKIAIKDILDIEKI